MKTLFLDCTHGVSGDMLVSSLLCHLENIRAFEREMEGLKLDAAMGIEDTVRYSLKGKSFKVPAKNTQPLRHLSDIESIINSSALKESIKIRVIKAFNALAEAEAKVHGISIDKVHFHELGAVDTIVDIVAFYVLLDMLSIERVIASPVNVGSGTVLCEHGILPVPAPAVAQLMLGRKVFSRGEDGERTTPTGAVLLAQSAEQSEMPVGELISTGCGFGEREFSDGNYVRSMLLKETDGTFKADEYAYLLECNIDDMTAEALAFAQEQILESGALDVWQEAIHMKKNRLGAKLCVLCKDAKTYAELIFKHTSTLGIRIYRAERLLRGESFFTELDGIPVKCTGDIRKPEYEYVKKRALERGVSLAEVYDGLK